MNNMLPSLWEAIVSQSRSVSCPWGVIGDFNVITCPEEKKGGKPFNISNCTDFLKCIEDVGVQDGAKTGSDHNPLLVNLNKGVDNPVKFFRFLNLWVGHKDFFNVVSNSWKESITGNPMWILHQKLKRTCKNLSVWSRATFGDIFEEVKKQKTKVAELEHLLIQDNFAENRAMLNHANAVYIRTLKKEESFLRQKARIK
nr:uncharacterized protein LOC104088803 [Nicotiana tomentosiformis]